MALTLLSGCANTAWYASSGGPPPSSSTGGSVRVVGADSFAALLGLGILLGVAYGPYYGAPPMDPDRRVVEHDCSKPIQDTGANLRCR